MTTATVPIENAPYRAAITESLDTPELAGVNYSWEG